MLLPLIISSLFGAHLSHAATASIDLGCDNSIYLFISDDDFATYTQLETGTGGQNWWPPTHTIQVTSKTKARIGCWNYGGPGWLESKLSVDGVSYNLALSNVGTLYEFVGFEKVNANDGNWVVNPEPDISDVAGLADPASLIYNGAAVGALAAVSDNQARLWPANMMNRQGVIWVDFDFGNVVEPECNVEYDSGNSSIVVQQNNQVGTADITDEMTIEFTVIINSFPTSCADSDGGWREIFLLNSDSERLPGVWLKCDSDDVDRPRGFHIDFPDAKGVSRSKENAAGQYWIDTLEALAINTPYDIKIFFDQSTVRYCLHTLSISLHSLL